MPLTTSVSLLQRVASAPYYNCLIDVEGSLASHYKCLIVAEGSLAAERDSRVPPLWALRVQRGSAYREDTQHALLRHPCALHPRPRGFPQARSVSHLSFVIAKSFMTGLKSKLSCSLLTWVVHILVLGSKTLVQAYSHFTDFMLGNQNLLYYFFYNFFLNGSQPYFTLFYLSYVLRACAKN